MNRLKIIKLAREFAEANVKARKYTNACNRKKTELRNAIKGFFTSKAYPVGTRLQLGDTLYGYETSESTAIPVEAWHQLYAEKRITKEKYFEALSVGRAHAVRIVGEDVVRTIEQTTRGTKADVRTFDLEDGMSVDEAFAIHKPKPIESIRRRIKRAEPPLSVTPTLKRKLRKITIDDQPPF